MSYNICPLCGQWAMDCTCSKGDFQDKIKQLKDELKDIKNADKRFLQLSGRGNRIKQLEDAISRISCADGCDYCDANYEILKALEQK